MVVLDMRSLVKVKFICKERDRYGFTQKAIKRPMSDEVIMRALMHDDVAQLTRAMQREKCRKGHRNPCHTALGDTKRSSNDADHMGQN